MSWRVACLRGVVVGLVVGVVGVALGVVVPGVALADGGPPYPTGSAGSYGEYAQCTVGVTAPFDDTDTSSEATYVFSASCFTSWDSSSYAVVITWDVSGAPHSEAFTSDPTDVCGDVGAGHECTTAGGLQEIPGQYQGCDTATFAPDGAPPCQDLAGGWTCTIYYEGSPADEHCQVSQVYTGAVYESLPIAPSDYWSGESGASVQMSCTVTLDVTTGDFSVAATSGTLSGQVSSTVSPAWGFEVAGVVDGAGNTYEVTDPGPESDGPDPAQAGGGTLGAPSATLTGTVGPVTSSTDGGLFFTVDLDGVPPDSGSGDEGLYLGGEGVLLQQAMCVYEVNPSSPGSGGSGLICPDGPGTCGDIANCALDDVTWDFVGLITVTIPDPLSVPAWLWCAFQQGVEWALYPTTGLVDAWRSIPPVFDSHVPTDWISYGLDYVTSFVSTLYDGASDLHGCVQVVPSGTILGVSWPGSGTDVCGGGGLGAPTTLVVAGYNAVQFGDDLYLIGIMLATFSLLFAVLRLARGILGMGGR